MTNLPHDFGPIYAETNMNRFPVEPWNTVSNLIFLAIFLYWAKLLGNAAKALIFVLIPFVILRAFVWHLLGGVASYFAIKYVYEDDVFLTKG